jgi:glycosyltransferase involved in cell wall biosynthesis
MNAFINKRILMLLENQPYPRDIRVRREAMALVAAGYQVSVICPADSGQSWRETVNGVQVYRFWGPAPGNGLLGYAWEYGYSMAAAFVLSLLVFFGEGFDVVHAHNPPDTFVFVAAFYKLFGKRFVFDHHDLSPEMYCARFSDGGSPLVYGVLVLLEKLTCFFSDHVIATNESYKRMEMERGRVPEGRITIVRNGLELSRLQDRPEPDRALRQMGKTIIGYVGVMGFQDGVDCLLRALAHLRCDLGRTDFHCVLIGDGDAWESLKSLARDLALDDHVWFTGRVSDADLLRYLSAADICVDPDPSNAFSDRSTMFKMMEYMSLGKPIVAFDLPEHRFTAQQAAVYVPNNDERVFARALAELMDDPARRQSLAAFGSNRIKTQLAWEYSVPNLLSAYRKILPSPDQAIRLEPLPQSSGKETLGSEIAIPPQPSVLSQTSSFRSASK